MKDLDNDRKEEFWIFETPI